MHYYFEKYIAIMIMMCIDLKNQYRISKLYGDFQPKKKTSRFHIYIIAKRSNDRDTTIILVYKQIENKLYH